ncbi:MAG: GYDIA family GHMP kinase [Flavobacteriaceae bacterium]
MQNFYSNGKLLITGEYVVLDGALALAVPTIFGQSLHVETINAPFLHWESFDANSKSWFKKSFHLNLNDTSEGDAVSQRIIQILQAAKQLNPDFLNSGQGFKVSTQLTFPKNWGLGTSSTLINNIARWAGVDAYKLLAQTFGGSGYDIACAQNNLPILYQLKKDKVLVEPIHFSPSFREHIYFVYLNKKQNSRNGIANYNANKTNIASAITEINKITKTLANCKLLNDFETLLTQHERIISEIIKQPTVKETLFADFKGCIKSLGAWGGDFVLATATENPIEYFNSKGFKTVMGYSEMVLGQFSNAQVKI